LFLRLNQHFGRREAMLKHQHQQSLKGQFEWFTAQGFIQLNTKMNPAVAEYSEPSSEEPPIESLHNQKIQFTDIPVIQWTDRLNLQCATKTHVVTQFTTCSGFKRIS
jgi:hypothetical protein